MKAVLSVLITLLLSGPGWALPPAKNAQRTEPQARLDAAVASLDGVFEETQASLEKIAATPEARRGEWEKIKPHLKALEAGLPGVYFYVRPDGNYYSLARDFTNLNLSDRPYFKTLFSGSPVRGFPLYSRSTGKKSALVAFPVTAGGNVTGALGVSIFLDELEAELDRKLALPEEYTWFVLDAEGNTMLDRDSDYIFMNALTHGGASLRDAVSRALKRDSGTLRYTLENPRHGYYKKLPHLEWRFFLAKIEGAKAPTPPKLTLSLERFVPALQGALDQIDGSMAQRIEKSGTNATQENDIRKVLRALYENNPYVINAGYVDTKGILRYIEPREYRNFENSDIGTQAHVVAVREGLRPAVSGAFTAVEGFQAVAIAHPLPGGKKQFVGAVTALIRPELLIDALLKTSMIPDDYELWIMQPDGRIVYDQDKDEIGRMLFDDPLYKGYGTLLELGGKIAAMPEGEGSYIYLAPGHRGKVIKDALWRTVRLHNREWRVVLAYRPYE